MPFLRIKPKVKTEAIKIFEIKGRHLAIVRVLDDDISPVDLEHAQQTINTFLEMDVLMVRGNLDIELVEVQPPTWHDRVKADDEPCQD